MENQEKWRTGKISETYKLTSFGKFLYLFLLPSKIDVNGTAVLRSLVSLSEFWSNPVLSKLAKSADRIRDEKKREIHLSWLVWLVFNMQDRIESRRLEPPPDFLNYGRIWKISSPICGYPNATG